MMASAAAAGTPAVTSELRSPPATATCTAAGKYPAALAGTNAPGPPTAAGVNGERMQRPPVPAAQSRRNWYPSAGTPSARML
jgi:hypothetical protein